MVHNLRTALSARLMIYSLLLLVLFSLILFYSENNALLNFFGENNPWKIITVAFGLVLLSLPFTYLFLIDTPSVFHKFIHLRNVDVTLYNHITKLPGRELLNEQITYLQKTADREKLSFSIFIIDINRFNEINDTLGYEYGDIILQTIAGRLKKVLRKSDIISHIGNDEFVVVMSKLDYEAIPVTISKIMKVFSRSIKLVNVTIELEVSCGIARYPEHGKNHSTLLKNADIALRHAKKENRSYSIYHSKNDPFNIKYLELYHTLNEAIKENQLVLFFQPKVNAKTGEVRNVEALLRWRRADNSFMSPAEFIPLAEKTGLIKPLTYWVIDSAFQQSINWSRLGIDIRIAVNISSRNLHNEDFIPHICNLLEKYKIAPSNIVFEITESAAMIDPEYSLRTLNRITELGIGISLDDYGTGYSSLSYIRKMPIEELKIDQSFIRNLDTDEDNAVIVYSTIQMAHNLGLTVIAEGVETDEILEILKIIGCDLIQGFYFSRPLPSREFMDWLATHNKNYNIGL